MNVSYELQEPFTYSWDLARILIVILVVLIISFVLIMFAPTLYNKFFSKLFRKTKVPSLKTRYIKKLEKLLYLVNTNSINSKTAYTRLSLYIREFIKKATGINVLSSSKEEIRSLDMPELSELMEEYYPPEFSKNQNGNIIGSIERSIEVIKRWK